MISFAESLYRDNAIYDFSKKAVENGLDIFRVFDSLNYFGKWQLYLVPVILLTTPFSTENVSCSRLAATVRMK